MKYLKRFESFSPINEEEEIITTLKKAFAKKDPIEEQLEKIILVSKKSEDEVRKVIEQIKLEKDLTKKEELLKSLIGDYNDPKRRDSLIRNGVKFNTLRDELGCMTPEEKESFDSRPGGSTGWEGSRGFH